MKHLDFYSKKYKRTPEEVFNYFEETILLNNRTWGYYTNWDNVFDNVLKYKIELGILNSLCGSKDFNTDFINILNKYPEVVKVFPTLLGIRDKRIEVLDDSKVLTLENQFCLMMK